MELSALFRFDLELSLYYRNKMTEKKSRNTLIFLGGYLGSGSFIIPQIFKNMIKFYNFDSYRYSWLIAPKRVLYLNGILLHDFLPNWMIFFHLSDTQATTEKLKLDLFNH